MENEQIQPTQPITTSPFPPVAPPPTMSLPPKSSTLPIALLSFLSLIFLSGMVYFYFQLNLLKSNLANNPSPASSSTLSQSPTTTTDATTSWQTHTIKELGITFKYPPSLQPMDYPNGIETKGEEGTQLCLSFIPFTTSFQLVKSVHAGGGACQGIFAIGSTSTDYEAGREGGFGDFQGYEKQNDMFKVNFVQGLQSDVPNTLVKEITNPNGIKILRIEGKNTETSEESERGTVPISGTPGEGHLGAIVNINKNGYSGFNIQMKLSSNLTSETFDQILSTLKFTN